MTVTAGFGLQLLARYSLLASTALFLCAAAAAQEPDAPEPDTTAVQEADEREIGFDETVRPIGFDQASRGRVLSDSLPALRPETDLTGLLATVPGTFTYLFDRAGWPDAWSPFGRSPNVTPLTFNGIPFTHVFTGRPAYNLVPFTFVEPPRLEASRFGRPFGVNARLRPFVNPVPITEGTYWRGGDGLQSIDVVHAQHRRRSMFGRPGFLNVLGSYSGRATDVDYPGSDLTRGRRVQLRLRLEQAGWSIELLNLHNRRRIGAQHGVIPPPGNFNAIYFSEIARVARPQAERRIVRNDLAGTARARVLPAGPSSLTAYRTTEIFRYRDDADTVETASSRLGVRVRQPIAASARHRLDAHVEAFAERVEPRMQFRAPVQRRRLVHVYVTDSLRAAGWTAALEAGWLGHDGLGGPTGTLALFRDRGPLHWRAELVSTRPPTPIAYETGFGRLRGRQDADAGRVLALRAEASSSGGGPFSAALGVFGARAADPVDVFAAGDSVDVLRASSPFRHAGVYAELGWRREADRGLYAVVRPTALRFLDAGTSEFHDRLADTLPAWFGRVRVGARYALFQRDLDIDLYVEGTAWSSFSSRHLHPETGLMVVPEAGSIVLGASNRIDVVAEVRIRSAKLFLVYDNAFAGTTLLPGNMLVPIYPLPAQRFRFGVYWPIFG